MDRTRKLELIQRSLGIRHKLKVHDSMKAPDTHEELSRMLLGRWELEDELKAIEEILSECRQENVNKRKSDILGKNPGAPEAIEPKPLRRAREAKPLEIANGHG